VLFALSAILDLDQEALFEKAGVEVPSEETQPTVEEAFASLAPLPIENPLAEPEPVENSGPTEPPPETELDADYELEAEVREHLDEAARDTLEPPRKWEPEPVHETFSLSPQPVGATAMRTTPEPAFISPPEPFQFTQPTPPVLEPSYMEDSEQRQLYRVRNLATVVLFVGLVIVLLWSLSNTVEALGTWWDDFFGSLRI
jgi:hypothetical protein